MKPIFLLLLLFCTRTRADSSDRTAIEATLHALSEPAVWKDAAALATFFRGDADRAEIHRLSRAHHLLLDPALLPWSERSIPRIKVDSIRWVTPDVAVVVAADTQFGSTGPHSIALFFVMKREAAAWKIAAARVEAGA